MPRRMLMLWLLAVTLSIAWIVWPDQVEMKQGALANVASIQGNVHIRPAGSFTWSSARVGSHLLALDAIATGPNSRAELLLENGATIVLPEDTQIKVQAQNVIPGMTIALIKGGLEVQTEPVPIPDKKVTTVKKKGQHSAKPITIQTDRYTVDLSRLEGDFRLQAKAGAAASKPDTVRVQNAKGAISLARLDDSESVSVDEQLEQSFPETAPLPIMDVIPEAIPEPPAPPPPEKKVEPIKLAEPETPLPESIPLFDEPVEELVPPRIKETQLSFWTVDSIEEAFEIPLVLPLGKPKAIFNAERWQSILRISVRGSKKSMIVKRDTGSSDIFFYLQELQSILPPRDLEGVNLIVESGLMRRGEEAGELRMSELKTQISLHSLQNRQAVTLQLDVWRFVEPTDQWVRTTPVARADITLHLFEPLMLAELEGQIRGARAFAVQPLQAESRRALLHFVRGKSIVATTNASDDKRIKDLIKELKPDLVYRGSFQDFLGGKGSFDLNKASSRAGDLYYVRHKRILKLDRNLFKTHSATLAFIRSFDPYFMGMPVEIIFSKD